MLPLRTFLIRHRYNFKHVLKAQDHLKVLNAGYKSHLSLDKIYPNSDSDYLRIKKSDLGSAKKGQQQEEVSDQSKEQFSGFIPIDSLQIITSRSSGPGGQGVNTANSKVEVRFHLESAEWIPNWIKPKLSEQEQGRLTKDGYLIVKSDMTRKQLLNQADCMNKIRQMIFTASFIPKKPTKEDVELHEKRKNKIKAEVLREKRIRSVIKSSRSNPEL
ncbi:peptidyl-tRNA hydrolase ICT1 mitochondrial [Biomphalaria glabrata]|uniref:Large ribosomal subunit protein mL62 n=1 Tax=Biomphalaria glabrata TaxID=6526 RepID=A0A9U8EMH8_BIOGL|nr:peptidyl-tRNA hydrolase ICT1, mitochondrial-like [Biomphalaria glabrata]KAI8766496.1 peptidyl-tRNA hydrolase ICT1; mitochondrial-like [Biomphalaria glabrata]